MIIIAFSNKTSKFTPNILCYKFKHVAPIVPHKNELIMYQFIKPGCVEQIKLKLRDIQILKSNGWEFIYIDGVTPPHDFDTVKAYTCVGLTKYAIGMKNWYIQTPLALYRKLSG